MHKLCRMLVHGYFFKDSLSWQKDEKCLHLFVYVFFADGLFGQCRTTKQDQVWYQVSVPVLKRMQEVLKQLMLQG